MKRLFCWSVLVCVCAGLFARGDDATNAKDDGKKMQGSWKPVTAELGGKPFPDEVLKTMKLVLTDGRSMTSPTARIPACDPDSHK